MDAETRYFPLAGMSGGMALATWGFLALALAVPAGMFLLAPPNLVTWVAPLFAALVWGVFALIWFAMRPRRFDVAADGVWIVWPTRSKLVPVEAIESAEIIPKRRLGVVWRLFGAAGVFGAFGLFRCRSLGQFDLYSSRGTGLVLIRRAGRRPLIVTPDSPDAFVEAVRSVCRPAE